MNLSLFACLQSTTEGVTPWFDPQAFGTWFGAIGGAGVGLLGAFFGSYGSWAAQRGRHRTLVLGGMGLIGGLCALSLLCGLLALVLGQPYGVWYPLALIGLIGGGGFLGLLPTMRRRYAGAETRRLEAESLRRS